MASIYQINKGVNKPIQFKGLVAQYIWYLAVAVFLLFILYAVLYFIGVNKYVALLIIGIVGAILVMKIYRLSNKYGEHGMMKLLARKALPKCVTCRTRAVFMKKAVKKRR